MARIVLLYVIAFMLPFAAYFLWLRWERWRSELPPEKRPLPWIPLASVGVALIILLTLSEAFLRGDEASGRYVPAHMQDGRLVPGRVESDKP